VFTGEYLMAGWKKSIRNIHCEINSSSEAMQL
jgi:hypothetical protein